MLFHQFSSQKERRKFGGSAFIEIQFCKLPFGTKTETLINNVNFWKDDSLYIHISDDEVFCKEYKHIFDCSINDNSFDIHGINYYDSSSAERIIDALLNYKPLEFKALIAWLEISKSYNGFYILGI